MDKSSNDPLDKLLRGAYPAVEVSADFKLKLWRRLINQPVTALWRVPAQAVARALAIGVIGGVWSFNRVGPQDPVVARVMAREERLDLFGNAPHDSLAGTVLRRMARASA